MILVITIMARCIQPECNKYSFYNIPTEIKGLYCLEHKAENMIDIKQKKCIYSTCEKRPKCEYKNKNNK
jgi:hypothetical protein